MYSLQQRIQQLFPALLDAVPWASEPPSWRACALFAAAFGVLYLRQISTLSRKPQNSPCPEHGTVFRVLYGLFSTQLATFLLSRMLHTKRNEPQDEQLGGTMPVVLGSHELRIKVIPILGGAFGGNYAYLAWDEADAERRAIAIDPADPYPVLRAAKEEGLQIDLLLCTHWHFDHAGGNSIMAKELPGLKVVAAAAEKARVPAATIRLGDLEEMRMGRIQIIAHEVPGHTLGSMVFELRNVAAPEQPAAAFTGDTLFCGGCGKLFEASANQMHASLARLTSRLARNARIFSGHEYTVMLLTMAVLKEPHNQEAREALREAKKKRAAKKPTVPSTLSQELTYNPWLRASVDEIAVLCGCTH